MMRWLFVVAVLGGLLVACGGGDDVESAGDAMKRQYGLLDKSQWSRYYDELHPAQQAIVNRDRFADCSAKNRGTISFNSVKVLETFDEEWPVSGTDIRGASKAVTIEIDAQSGSQNQKVKHTGHQFNVDGKWRWVMGPEAIEAFKQGQCPV